MNYTYRTLLALAFLLASRPITAQTPKEYTGIFAPKLVESNRGISPEILVRAKPEHLKLLPVPPKEGEEVFLGPMNFYKRENGKLVVKRTIPLGLVISADSLILYANVDGDTVFTAKDRYVMKDLAPGGIVTIRPGDKEVWVDVPMPAGSLVQTYPIHFVWSPSRAVGLAQARRREQERFVWASQQMLQGEADIAGRKVLVQYPFNILTGDSPDIGNYGVDVNGDGKVDAQSKTEWAYRAKVEDTLVFQSGDVYFSPKSVDKAQRRFVLADRLSADYKFIEMAAGGEIPDFTFVDISGATRKFSEFRGKYVLLDFWGTWCGPCRAEIPHLRTAYEQYKSRGFEILGMDKDSDIEGVKTFLTKQNITWPQTSTAMPGSGEKLLDFMSNTLRVNSFPTAILVDPQGKIVSTHKKGELPLRGTELLETLEKLLPAS